MKTVTVLGGGLAGCEAAWHLAEAGCRVTLYEARPATPSPAHQTDQLAELVCSNSLGSAAVGTGKGLLTAEMEACGSLIVSEARAAAVPAGRALAVDRARFAAAITRRIADHPCVELLRREVSILPAAPAVVATGPLTSAALADDLARVTGAEHLHFYDATSPILDGESIDRNAVFAADRRDADRPGDYLNCPLDRDEYTRFYQALRDAELVTPHGFEDEKVFEGCMPIEQLAARGVDTLRFGPMRPVGLVDPRHGRRPWAVVQLRREDVAGGTWNIVGFQTRMKHGEQQRVFRLIPGLEKAEFLRFGVIHRNTYVDGPRVLAADLSLRARPGVRLAGQLAGVEGYLESAAIGRLAAFFTLAELRGESAEPPPPTTMLGALVRYITTAERRPIQPMNANFGLLPFPEDKIPKKQRKEFYHQRALRDLSAWLAGGR